MTEKLHNVHLYAVVRVKVLDVPAESHREAIEQAEKKTHLSVILNCVVPARYPGCKFMVGGTEYAHEIVGYLVDEQGDEEFANSKSYDQDYTEITPAPPEWMGLTKDQVILKARGLEARINELLEANNAMLARARAAENRLKAVRTTVEAMVGGDD